MQVYNKSNSIGIKTLLLLCAVLFIAYLPVSSFLYFIKNDAFNGYFPPRFFMSESLHAGYLPLWNPYINFGFPQYGDMSGGYWSPFTWLIAAIGYNAYTFTIEILLYILIGGLGMYKLVTIWSNRFFVCCIAAISFMCCGFNIGHLQHVNWLSGIAFLTWCIYYFIKLHTDPCLKNILLTALMLYLFICGAHPSLVISAVYFFTVLMIFMYFSNEIVAGWRFNITSYFKSHSIMAAILLLVSTGMIISYMDIIPHFVRGQKLDLETSVNNASGLRSWISVLLPFSAVKNNALNNIDLSMRNHYMGLVMLLFMLSGLVNKKTKWQWFFLVTGIIFILLSAGSIFKTAAYYVLPFMSYVRLNGIYSGIAIICFILFATIEINKLYTKEKQNTVMLQRICAGLMALLSGCIIYGFVKALNSHESIIFNWPVIRTSPSFAKALVDGITWYDTLWIQGTIQLFFSGGILIIVKKKRFNALLFICIADMIVVSLFNIPYTGAGKAPVSDVQKVLDKSPAGIPIPVLQPIILNDTLTVIENGLTGHWSMYGKQPGVTHEIPYPITLTNAHNYFDLIRLNPSQSKMSYPVLFNDSTGLEINKIVISRFNPGSITSKVNASENAKLILQQNYYQYWFYDDGFVHPVNRYGINFMSVPLVQGENNITIFFNPVKIKTGMLISFITFCCMLIALVFIYFRRPKSLSLS